MQVFKSNRYGDAVVVEDVGNKRLKVRFVNTGHEDIFHITSLKRGEFRDKTVSLPLIRRNDRFVGSVLKSNNYGDMVILSINGKRCVVQFLQTGYTTDVYIDNATAGKVKDPYYPSSYGVGYLGEFKKNSYWKQCYQLWRNMMKRCYSEKDLKGYYGKGVSVCTRWLCFANFLEDLPKLENFEKWLKGHTNGDRYNLDKDLKVEGNKVYCPELCSFVTEYENKSAGAVNARRLDKLKNK